MNSRVFALSTFLFLFFYLFNAETSAQSLVFKQEISAYKKGLLPFAGWTDFDSNSNGSMAICDREYHYVYILNEQDVLVQRLRPALDYPIQLISGVAIDNAGRVIVGLSDREGFIIYNNVGEIERTVTSGFHYSFDTDDDGNIYTFGNAGVTIYESNGTLIKSFAVTTDNSSPSFQVSQGRIFVSDNTAVTVFSTDGVFLFKFDHLGSVNTPGKIAIHQNGNIYIGSYWNEVGIYSPAGVLIRKFAPALPEGVFPAISDIEFSSDGRLFLSRPSTMIHVFGENESPLSQIGTDHTKSKDVLHFPSSLSFDSNGNIKLISGTTQNITTFDNDGNAASTMNTVENYELVSTYMPSLTVDQNDRVIFFGYDKTDQNKVRILNSTGEVIKEILQPNSPYSFSHGACVATDSENNIYVYDLDFVYIYNENGDYLRSFRSPFQDVLPELDQYPFFLRTSSLFIDKNDNVFLLKPNTEYVVMANTQGVFQKHFHAPYAIAVTADAERELVYIATKLGLQIFDYDGNFVYSVSVFELMVDRSLISDMAVNPVTHHLVISDFFNQRLLEFQFLNSQQITFEALPYGEFTEKTFPLVATVTSGLPVSFVSADPGIASINNNVVTLHGPGGTEITALQEGNDFFQAATPVVQTLNVNVILALPSDPLGVAITAHPNPTDGLISFSGIRSHDQVDIISMIGDSKKLDISESQVADISPYASGVYLIRITRGTSFTTLKILKK
jgi:hypothetical protein